MTGQHPPPTNPYYDEQQHQPPPQGYNPYETQHQQPHMYYGQQPTPVAYYPPPPEQQAYYPPPPPVATPHPNTTGKHHEEIITVDTNNHHKDDEKFAPKAHFRDWVFALLFILHLGGVLVILAFSLKKDSTTSGSSEFEDFIPAKGDNMWTLIYLSIACGGVAIIYSILWLIIMKAFARQLIIGTLILSILFYIGMAVLCFAVGQIVGGIFAVLLVLIQIFCYWSWRNRIPFATRMLKTISETVKKYPGTTVVAYLSILVQCIWVAVWIATLIVGQRLVVSSEDDTETNNDPDTNRNHNFLVWLIFIFLLFSFYWVSQVIKNVVHVTVSGTFASWYFLNRAPSTDSPSMMPSNPTIGSFKRATTYSFGSICLGSLIVAVISTIRAIVNAIRRNEGDSFIGCCLACILSCIERLVEYFNLYAFTQVAIYGKSYCKAAKDTWKLFKSHGFEAIINDNLIGHVLVLGAMLGGIITAIVGGALGLAFLDDYWGTMVFLGFFIGYVFSMLTMEVVESGVATIFVCFAMDPAALQRNDPKLFQKFQKTYKK